jgi:hypothetical protein
MALMVKSRRNRSSRQRGGRLVELGACGDDVHALILAVEHDGGAELVVDVHAAGERAGELAREGDAVPLHGDVDVEAALAEEDVADGAADQVDPLVVLADRRHRLEDGREPVEAGELVCQRRPASLARLVARPEGPENVAARDNAGHAVVVSEHGDAAFARVLDQPLQLRERRVLSADRHAGAHDPLDRGVRQLVADRLVEVLSADGAGETAVLHHQDAALPVALAGDHRVGDRVVGPDGTDSPGHHVARAHRLADGRRQPVQHAPTRVRERAAEDRRRRLGVASASDGRSDRRRVDFGDAAAGDAEDPLVHLDQDDENPTVGQVDDLVCEVRDAFHVARPRDRGHEHLGPGHVDRLGFGEERVQQLALRGRQRHVQEVGHELLVRPVAEAPRQRLGVPLGRRRVRERTGVLVDPEREGGRLHRRDAELALREDADERRRQRSVLREHRVLRRDPLGELARVMVEDEGLDVGIERHRLELAEASRMRGLDDDQATDRVELEPSGFDDPQLVGVEPVELAHVSVERPGDARDGARVQPPGGEHRRESVEVGVAMCGDDVLSAHLGSIVPVARGRIVTPLSVTERRASQNCS